MTIDDGYRSTFDIAFPILKQHGFPATIFLYSDFVGAGDALTWAQMKEMAASGLVDIQPHSKTHANLTLRLPDETEAHYRDRVRREVDTPIALIKERLALSSVAFAYPYGDVNEIVVDLLARDGAQMGVTVTPGGNGFFAYPYMLRRNMVFGNEFGVSIADTLRVYASEMRNKRVVRAEAKANLMPLQLAIGTLVFTVPPAMLIMAGPSVISIIRAFQGMGH